MTPKETAALLTMFATYWPSFQVRAGGDGLPSTIDVWADLLAGDGLGDCINALKRLVREPGRVFAPTASEFLAVLREIKIERLQLEEIEERKRLRLNAPRERYTTPEKAKIYFAQISEILSGFGDMNKTKAAKKPGPVLDERHDWQATFEKLNQFKKLDMVDRSIPTVKKVNAA